MSEGEPFPFCYLALGYFVTVSFYCRSGKLNDYMAFDNKA